MLRPICVAAAATLLVALLPAAANAASPARPGPVYPVSPVPPVAHRPSTAPITPCEKVPMRAVLSNSGGFSGTEYPPLSLTNTSTGRCSVLGHPSLRLVRQGHLLTRPAAHARSTTAFVVLNSGQSVSSTVSVNTRCDAPLSDSALVALLGQSTPTRVAASLRGCADSVTPLR